MPYKPIPKDLARQLDAVPPSRDGTFEYRPCLVELRDGRQVDCVYVSPLQSYLPVWGVTPEQDKDKASLLIEDVIAIRESPSRLPVRVANKIYEAGESGMGYCTFALRFRDGTEQRYTTGNAVDFLSMPPGKRPEDVVDVITHRVPRQREDWGTLKYYWCLFDAVAAAA